ncbi:MAG: dephospho-CoA kinase [Chlorobiaceae bacterium]|nr:dephospho-CoA kinase [Chlorobiaceae bacterium]
MSSKKTLVVGVSGGLGCGKSTVCSYLSELGCALFESDRVAKELQISDSGVIEGMRELFGDAVYRHDAGGALALDRKAVASVVFSSPEKLEALNRLIHPRVYREFRKGVLEAERTGKRIMVKEAAILFESGGHRDVDVVVVVAADMDRRIHRAVEKGMGTREEIMQRIAMQWPQEKLTEKADYVIWNNGSREELKKETERVFQKLLTLAASVGNRRCEQGE